MCTGINVKALFLLYEQVRTKKRWAWAAMSIMQGCKMVHLIHGFHGLGRYMYVMRNEIEADSLI